MKTESHSVIIQGVTRFIIPFLQIFGLYVIFHGHYSPGGGFQGGAMLAASILLERLVFGREATMKLFPIKVGIPLGIIGLIIFAGVGAFGLDATHSFLDYAALPLKVGAAELRAFGILFVEIGVALAVLGTLVAIYDQLMEGGES